MAEGRYFFAVWPPDEIQKRLAQAARRLSIQGRPQHAEDLHMTLVFLGQLSEAQRPCVEAVADALPGEAFSLAIDGVGYWYRPRVLWAGPSVTPEPLSRLVHDLQQGLKACGCEPERRHYKPHITLCRKAVRAKPVAITPAIEWPVSEFVLAVSGGGAPGTPRYRVLKRWPLAAAAIGSAADVAAPASTPDSS